ncbi:MAG: hypothetical protein K2K82_02595 [Muribaculaceae bacterium]|nr:hypothetical protein [Muribaculaceae bacterium]
MSRLLCLLIALMPLTLSAVLPKLKRVKTDTVETVMDTIALPRTDAVRFSGYEKENRSTRETFFVTNNLGSDSTLTAIEVTFTYFTMDGKQLHQRTELIHCLIPPGETRALSISSWDANHAFHYHLSTPPRQRRSAPFRVTSTPLRLILQK